MIFDNYDDIPNMRDMLCAAWPYFCLLFRNLPQEREEAINLMIRLVTKYSLDFMTAFFKKDIVIELLYLL